LKLLVKIIENYTDFILSITFIYYCSGAKSRIKLYLDWGTCFYLRLPSSDNRKNSKNDFFLEYWKTSPFFLTQNSNRFVEKVDDLIANLRAIVIFITFLSLFCGHQASHKLDELLNNASLSSSLASYFGRERQNIALQVTLIICYLCLSYRFVQNTQVVWPLIEDLLSLHSY
jgi:hypothetical protein